MQKRVQASRARRLASLDRRIVGSSYRLRFYPITIERARGVSVWDVDGKEYIDFTSGAAVANTGYGHPRVLKAAADQARRLTHGISLIFQNTTSLRLAERLTEITPGGFPKKVWFGASGSDACDVLYDLLPAATKGRRRRIITFFGSHHGLTVAGSYLSANPVSRRYLASPRVVKVPYPYPYRSRFSPEECSKFCIDFIEREVFPNVCPPDDTAGILVEPLESVAGEVVPPDDFLPQLRELCDRHGILLADDEVKTGFGRTGRMFAIEHYGVVPDVVVLGKSMASGFPLGACVGRTEVLDAEELSHGSSAAGQPVSCAAALATIDVVVGERLAENASRQGAYIRKRLVEMMDGHPLIGDVRGKGLLIGVELVRDRRTKEPASKDAHKVSFRAWQNGLLLTVYGAHSNVLELAPPLTITRRRVDAALEMLEEALSDVERGAVPDSVLDSTTWRAGS